jgi:hypothetical protein
MALVHPQDRGLVESGCHAALDPAGGGVYASEFRVRHADGGWRTIDARARMLFEGGARRAARCAWWARRWTRPSGRAPPSAGAG